MRRAFLANKEFNVLIVDDDVSSIVLLERALSNFSRLANIDVVERGKDAVKAMASKEYDVVFMDHEMPDLKGPDVVKLADNALAKQMIKNGGEDPQKIQVITYSAKKWEDWDADQLAYISMQGHLMKGESYSSLKGRLSRLIGEPQQGEKALAAI
jgi:CheY-like chemotaxis protein